MNVFLTLVLRRVPGIVECFKDEIEIVELGAGVSANDEVFRIADVCSAWKTGAVLKIWGNSSRNASRQPIVE